MTFTGEGQALRTPERPLDEVGRAPRALLEPLHSRTVPRETPEPQDTAEAEPKPLTLKTLFDIYGEEVTPTKRERSGRYDGAAIKMFLKFFGKDRDSATLSQRDWIDSSETGDPAGWGRAVSRCPIERSNGT